MLALTLAAPACKRAHHADAVLPEPATVLSSLVKVSDPGASAQLTRGFYQLEDNAWRWTAKQFTVALKTPPGASTNGGQLTLNYNLPEVVLQKLGTMKIAAGVNGKTLGSEPVSTPGDHVFTVSVPAGALAGDAISVDFECDKALPPTAEDARELALVVTSIGIESK